jgi:hypothetical protein
MGYSPLCTKTAKNTINPKLPLSDNELAPRAIPSAAPCMTNPRVAFNPAKLPEPLLEDPLLRFGSRICSRLGMIGLEELRCWGWGRSSEERFKGVPGVDSEDGLLGGE